MAIEENSRQTWSGACHFEAQAKAPTWHKESSMQKGSKVRALPRKNSSIGGFRAKTNPSLPFVQDTNMM